MKKLLYLLFIFSLSLFFIGCNNEPTEEEIDWDSKTVETVTVYEPSIEPYYEYDEFDCSMIQLHITYTDGTERNVPTTLDMYDEASQRKLAVPGNPRVKLTYYDNAGLDYELVFIVHLMDLGLLDKNLNILEEYDVVIKAIRDKTKDSIDFICEDTLTPVNAFQFAYSFDSSIMQVSNMQINPNIKGIIDYDLRDNEIIVTIILNQQMSTETKLFTVDFTGNFRESNLQIDESFDNLCYLVKDDETIKLKVLYHASKK